MNDVKTFFKSKFKILPVSVVHAPGRLELIGNHTDYNEGLVMALAIDKHISMAAAPRKDGKIELVSSSFPKSTTFFLDKLVKDKAAPWANYVKGVLDQLRKAGVHFSGFSAAIHSTLPIGAGLSSSAALEVATALTVRELYPYKLLQNGVGEPPKRGKSGKLPKLKTAERLLLAKLCQRAENQFVGVNCGLLDQVSSLFGKAHHAVMIDCQSLTVETVPMVGEVAVVVCNSGVKHELVGGEYNERRQMCEAAAKALGVRALRAIDPPRLEANKSKLSERAYQCAYHVVGENFRVAAGEKALRAGDFTQFGEFMFQSHETSRHYFKNSTEELDLLVDLAHKHPAILGARLTGGGFGGATINLVKRDGLESFKAYMAKEYEKKSGHKLEPMVCQIADGAE